MFAESTEEQGNISVAICLERSLKLALKQIPNDFFSHI